LAMANDLLYKASLHLGASPQNKRGSLLYKIPTVGNRQQIEPPLVAASAVRLKRRFID
jgi:hypothetical protein